ncbi:hypothetical protein [Litoreibacter janthinus]|nr:hypothetical protein [Litoreibacter janthinus]
MSDLGQNMLLRRQSSDLKASLTRLTNELASGERQNLGEHLRGDFAPLAGLERSLSRLDGFAQARADLTMRVTATQTSLSAIQGAISNFGTDLAAAASLEQPDVLEAKVAGASGKLSQVVSHLNSQVSGQFLFSGVATGQQPLLSGEEILSEVRGIASSATSVAEFLEQVSSWFDDAGGGFETLVYAGSSQTSAGVTISNARQIDLPIKADDAVFRAMLKEMAIASVVSEGLIATAPEEKRAVLSGVGQRLIASEQTLIGMQRDTGVTESLLAEADIADGVERGLLEAARSRITSADPFETASALEAVQFQIEALYVLTARTSQLRLSDYL